MERNDLEKSTDSTFSPASSDLLKSTPEDWLGTFEVKDSEYWALADTIVTSEAAKDLFKQYVADSLCGSVND